MKVGDLVLHGWNRDTGIIVHIFENGDVCVLFEDGEYQVDAEDCEVADEAG